MTSCLLGRRIGYFRLQFRKEFFNLPPTCRILLISRKTSNLWMLLDLGIMLLPFDFQISISLRNDVSWTICKILASASFSSFTDKTLLLTYCSSLLLLLKSLIAIHLSNWSATALTVTCFLTSGLSMLSSGVVSIAYQVSLFCHKNAGPWNHLSTLFF